MSRLISPEAIATLTIWQEARGETYEGKIAVAEVIRNRTDHKYSSDGTIEGTCLRAYQFSGWMPKDPNLIASIRCDLSDPIVNDCANAWNEALVNRTNLAHSALLYANLHLVSPPWAKVCVVVAEIGNHTFFIPPKKGA